MEIKLNHITKNYGTKQALKDINLTLKPGITGLLGKNGVGKSTLMRLLSTIDKPTTGEILYQNTNVVENPDKLRIELGYLPQNFGVYPNMNPVEFLEYMAAMKSLSMKEARKRIDELLEILNLAQVRKQLLGGFSGGMKQRVGIAQALLNDPSVVILDEPTVGLDPEERIQFRSLLFSHFSDRIIILSTHIVSDIESIAPSIAILSNGTLIADTTPEQLIAHVKDKVWEMVITVDKFKEIEQKFMISNSIQREDGIHVRVVSDRQPSLETMSCRPTLEDAYLYHTKAMEVK